MTEQTISPAVVSLARSDLRQMTRLVRLLYRLSRSAAYRALVLPGAPEIARFDPGHDAVMMGYDFHVTADGPRLIEVNTNAGGSLLAFLADRQAAGPESVELPAWLRQKLFFQFEQEFRRFSQGRKSRPESIVIIDEEPEKQYLYPEMQKFAELFREWGAAAEVVPPSDLEAGPDGVFLHGAKVDLVYNRHCDFYLDEPEMAGLRAAYLAGSVCLTPNPFAYALLADKRRLPLWGSAGFADQMALPAAGRTLLQQTIPASRLLSDFDAGEAWDARRQSVFKPVTRFGSRGVLLGEKITHKRFDELPPDETLVQELVPPSMTEVPGYIPMKTDFRAFAYRSRVLGITARLYRGQVTNLRTEGGGFARVRLER